MVAIGTWAYFGIIEHQNRMSTQIEIMNKDLEKIRHSAAHILAAAVKKLYPKAKLAIGPATEEGFYYDFDNLKITEEDLRKIEKEMKNLIGSGLEFKKVTRPKTEAKKLLKDEPYKLELLEDLKDIPGPKILHCLTKKGKGYNPAEEGCATQWHAPGIFQKETGKIIKQKIKKDAPIKYQDVFGKSIIELAKENDKIVGVTPAMLSGSSLNLMMKQMPEKTFDVGIAEQHAVTFSAGLATQGLIPFCNIYSSFMQRAYDQLIHDVALQDLNVVFCLDRGGLVEEDGATHHGAYDIAYLRCIPNMVVAAPMNEQELRNMMYTAQLPNKGPFSIRYPRGNGVMENWQTPFKELEIGKGQNTRNDENDSDFISIIIGNLLGS